MGIRILRFSEVEERTGLKRRYIYALEARNEFPKRVKIGDRACGFVESEVDEWLASRVAQRDAKEAPAKQVAA